MPAPMVGHMGLSNGNLNCSLTAPGAALQLLDGTTRQRTTLIQYSTIWTQQEYDLVLRQCQMLGGWGLPMKNCLLIDFLKILGILIQLRLQLTFSLVGVEDDLCDIEARAKEDHDHCNGSQIPERQAGPHARKERHRSMKRGSLFHPSHSLSRWRGQTIANATNGCQQFDLKRIINFSPQTTHIDIDHVGTTFKIIVPDMLLNHIASNDLIGVVHKKFQQSIFARCEIDRASFPLHAMGDRIDYQITNLHTPIFVGGLTAQQGTQTCQQFTNGKRFDQIIVGPTIQSLYAIIHTITCSQKENWGMNTPSSQFAADLQTILLRQENIQDDQIVRRKFGKILPFLSIIGSINAIPFMREIHLEGTIQTMIIFYHKNTHCAIPLIFARIGLTGFISPPTPGINRARCNRAPTPGGKRSSVQ